MPGMPPSALNSDVRYATIGTELVCPLSRPQRLGRRLYSHTPAQGRNKRHKRKQNEALRTKTGPGRGARRARRERAAARQTQARASPWCWQCQGLTRAGVRVCMCVCVCVCVRERERDRERQRERERERERESSQGLWMTHTSMRTSICSQNFGKRTCRRCRGGSKRAACPSPRRASPNRYRASERPARQAAQALGILPLGLCIFMPILSPHAA
jgi:hypothetical protein